MPLRLACLALCFACAPVLAEPAEVGQALDRVTDTLRESDQAKYLAACEFIGAEVARLDGIAARAKGSTAPLRHDRESGARLYRHKDGDLRIDYLVMADGKTLVSTAEFGPRYIGKRFNADSLRKTLLLTDALPATFTTGCDGHELHITTKAARIASMKIEAYID